MSGRLRDDHQRHNADHAERQQNDKRASPGAHLMRWRNGGASLRGWPFSWWRRWGALHAYRHRHTLFRVYFARLPQSLSNVAHRTVTDTLSVRT